MEKCKKIETPIQSVTFDYTNTLTKVTVLEEYIGKSGIIQLKHLAISSFEAEDYIIAACVTDDGVTIESELAKRLFSLSASINGDFSITNDIEKQLEEIIFSERSDVVSENANRNKEFFDTEIDKLDLWADDMKLSLDKEIKDLDAEIKLKKSEAKKMLNLESKVRAQRRIKELEKKRSEKRMKLYEAQDEVDEKKENLLNEIETRLNQSIKVTELFSIKWTMI